MAYRSSINVNNINKSLSGLNKSLLRARDSARSVRTTITESTRDKRKSFSASISAFNKRRESARRKEREDIVEASSITGAISRSTSVVANSTRGFLGRILDFLGTLLVGWALTNLPGIIKAAQNLIERMKKYFELLNNFRIGLQNFLISFGDMVGEVTAGLSRFDFLSIKKAVDRGMNRMGDAFIQMNNSIDSVVRMLKQDINKLIGLDLFDIPKPDDGGDGGGDGGGTAGQTISTKVNQFNNIPEGAILVQSDANKLYLMYSVPGAGVLYQGNPIWMFYEVKDNDLYEAGILTPGAPYEINMMLTEEEIDKFVYGGNTADLPGNDPQTGRAPHPFTSFVENVSTQAQIAPWILDIDSIKLLAEAALEGREVTEAEWRMTNWYQTHSEAERNWQRLYYSDPTTAQNTVNDYKIQVGRALQAAGVTGGYDPEQGIERAAPDALVSWIANKWVSGQWTESYTSEQLALFADPFRAGTRDVELTNYVSSAGVEGLERTAEQEDRVRQLYTQWLGPVFGKLTDEEVSQKAGRLRNDPDYEQALIEQLKNNRLALFPQYTNPELTYNDIATPWRNLTTSVWGQAADETQSWWQDMVATNNFTEGTATLRSKGLESNVEQVTIEATEALQKALGKGSQVADLGANR